MTNKRSKNKAKAKAKAKVQGKTQGKAQGKATSTSAPAQTNPEALALRANTALNEGKFREAIDAFKGLSKTGADRAHWEPGLLAAYRGRALELEAKGMGREALMIWDNRALLSPQLAPELRHITLMLRLGRIEPALAGYRQFVQGNAHEAVSALQAQLAALNLSGSGGLKALAADDPVRRDGSAAQAALEAYCRGESGLATESLRQIPFRSPYRDFVTVMKALIAWPDDPAAATTLLDRVPETSSFSPLAAAARLAQLPESAFLDAIKKAGPQTLAFASTLRGWSQDRVNLWRELSSAELAQKPASWAGLLKRLRTRLEGGTWLRRKTRAVILEFPPHLIPRSPPADLTALDVRLIAALQTERRESSPLDLFRAWNAVIAMLSQSRDGTPVTKSSDDALRIAIMQRRFATDLNLLKTYMRELVEEALEQSIELDPDYAPGFLLLSKHFRNFEDFSDARRVIGIAEKRWPQEVTVLSESMEVALATGALKRAAGLAERILRQDPINHSVRRSLVRAHLGHGRKQWRNGRHDLTDKELESAARWANDDESRARIDLLRTLCHCQAGTVDASELAAATERVGPGAIGIFVLAQEAHALGLPHRDVLGRIGLSHIPALDPDGVLNLAHFLRKAADESRQLDLEPPLKQFSPALKKAAKLPLARDTFDYLCETFLRLHQFKLCSVYAQTALKRWPDDPLFVLHAFLSKVEDPDVDMPDESEYEALEDALDQAHDDGDTRLVLRIQNALDNFLDPRFDDSDSDPWDY